MIVAMQEKATEDQIDAVIAAMENTPAALSAPASARRQ